MTRDELVSALVGEGTQGWLSADNAIRFFEREFGIELDEIVKAWDGVGGIKWRIVQRPGQGLIVECCGGKDAWYQPESELQINELMRREILRLGEPEMKATPVADDGILAELLRIAAEQTPHSAARSARTCGWINLAAQVAGIPRWAACSKCACAGGRGNGK